MKSVMGMMGLVPLMYLFYFIIPLAPIAYIFLKWRAYRDHSPPDPQLGIKVVLFYFKTLAYQAILVAVTLIIYGILKGGYKDEMRTGFGILVGGGIIYSLHLVMIQNIFKTTSTKLVSRFYGGFNLVIAGILGMVSLVVLCVVIFQGDVSDIKLPVSALLVYGLAWVYQAASLIRKR